MLSLHHAFHRPLSRELRAIDRLFSEPFARSRGVETHNWPRTKVLSREDAIEVVAEVPGFGPDDIEIDYHEGVLSLKSRASEESETSQEQEQVLFDEQTGRSLKGGLRFGELVDAEDAGAKVENGILRVTLPKQELAKPRKIEVRLGQ